MSQKQDINAEKIIAKTMTGLLLASVALAVVGLAVMHLQETESIISLAVLLLLLSPLCVSAVTAITFAIKKEKGMAFVSAALCLILAVTVAVRYGLAN